jgi:hypothetical protein
MCGFRMEFRFFWQGVLAALLFLICLNPVMATNIICGGLNFSDNDGDTYYEISTCQQLQAMGSCVSHNFELVSNINCSFTAAGDQDGAGSNDIWTNSNGFIPVGNSTNPFNKKFNGNDFNIINLHIYQDVLPVSDVNVGLFGTSTTEINISNVGLVDSNILVNFLTCGGLVGSGNNVKIINSFNSGVMGGRVILGGLVGESTGKLEILNSYNAGVMRSPHIFGNGALGGLVGQSKDLNIFKSYNLADINGWLDNPSNFSYHLG